MDKKKEREFRSSVLRSDIGWTARHLAARNKLAEGILEYKCCCCNRKCKSFRDTDAIRRLLGILVLVGRVVSTKTGKMWKWKHGYNIWSGATCDIIFSVGNPTRCSSSNSRDAWFTASSGKKLIGHRTGLSSSNAILPWTDGMKSSGTLVLSTTRSALWIFLKE